MSADDRMTKAELIEQVAALEAERDEARADYAHAERRFERFVESIGDTLTEPVVIGRCVAALNRLPDTVDSFDRTRRRADRAAVVRVLRYLADRFDVTEQLMPVEVRDCDRRHLDDASNDELVSALRYGHTYDMQADR